MIRKYVYCILDGLLPEQDRGIGISGFELYTIFRRGICALVSDLPASGQIDYTEENILLHAEINERMMEYCTVLPMRFGTVLSGEHGVSAMIDQYHQDFISNFERLKDRVELGLKVIWPIDRIKAEVADEIGDCKLLNAPNGRPGFVYLKIRLTQHLWENALNEKADKFITEINALLDSCIVEYRGRRLATEKLVVNGAYLVKKDRVEEFKVRYDDLKERYPDFKFLLTGPWPAYNFIQLNSKNDSGKGRNDGGIC